MRIQNAQINDVSLFIEDHGILTFAIGLKLGDGYCRIGNYALDRGFSIETKDGKYKSETLASPAGLECIRRIMEIVGVDAWEKLKGSYVRYEHNGIGSHITKIGNILKDEWIDIGEFFKNYDYQHWIEQYMKDKKGI